MIIMNFNSYEVVKPQCKFKNHCEVWGMDDDCICPHYDEIREAFFSDIDIKHI